MEATKDKGSTQKEPLGTEQSSIDEQVIAASFSKLPIEVRLIIWKYTCFHQRNVDIALGIYGELMTQRYSTSDGEYRCGTVHPFSYCSRSPPPVILHVNQESRIEGLKHYRLEFGVSVRGHHFSVIAPPQIYINWEVDRVCLVNRMIQICADNLARRFADNKLKYLAINMGLLDWEYRDLDRRFTHPELEELLMYYAVEHYEGGRIEFKEFDGPKEDLVANDKKGKPAPVRYRRRRPITDRVENARDVRIFVAGAEVSDVEFDEEDGG